MASQIEAQTGAKKIIQRLEKIRNIGISAHIDSGKTTVTERILFYTARIRSIHEVKGKDGIGAKMDFMDLERERGITIQSAATYCKWKGFNINIIDTPGHVDFTIEVERALRVLDSAILILCGVAGVQSQSITVDRQMKRYDIPRLAYINKLDRVGADPFKVISQMREKLNLNAVPVQIPIGLEEDHQGVVDLITMKAYYFEGAWGEKVVEAEIPKNLTEMAANYRERMLDAASMFSDELTEAMLDGDIKEEQIISAIRTGTLQLKLCPVFMGSAYKNKGIQKLLDGVCYFLANPSDVQNRALDLKNDEKEVVLCSKDDAPFVALTFKLEDGRYGQLTYIRIYQGTLKKGMVIKNIQRKSKNTVGRLVQLHSNEMHEISIARAGDIVALFGIDCNSGDTFTDGKLYYSMTSMHIPEPVMDLVIEPHDKKAAIAMIKAINRFCKEDPTFKCKVDDESSQTIISGMGELHLEVYLERMRREFKVNVSTGAPQVAYRETITKIIEFDYIHKKQTGGAGQYARVKGVIEPYKEDHYLFEDKVTAGEIPKEFIPSCNKGFQSGMERGPLIGFPATGIKIILEGGTFHEVDSSDMAFQIASLFAFHEFVKNAGPTITEPIMKLSVEGPVEFQGSILTTINQRRGIIIGTREDENFVVIDADVPLAEMFGYSTVLRSATQGKAEFTMEFKKYEKVPKNLAENLMKRYTGHIPSYYN
jgi:elongation factor G